MKWYDYLLFPFWLALILLSMFCEWASDRLLAFATWMDWDQRD